MEILGRIPPPEENDFMQIGNIMEPTIAKIYMNQEKIEIFEWQKTCIHPNFEWLIAHPDYYFSPCWLESTRLRSLHTSGAMIWKSIR